MLDQNTDRNIWMIGAVLVGVAMIIVAKGGFKQIFAKIITWFTSIIDKGTSSSSSVTTATILLSGVDWASLAQHASCILHI